VQALECVVDFITDARTLLQCSLVSKHLQTVVESCARANLPSLVLALADEPQDLQLGPTFAWLCKRAGSQAVHADASKTAFLQLLSTQDTKNNAIALGHAWARAGM
jgi:hypothetical protein